MRNFLKNIFFNLPLLFRKTLLLAYEKHFTHLTKVKEEAEYGTFDTRESSVSASFKKNILLYGISGLGFGGTEKSLQTIANVICDDYNVFFLYSDKNASSNRKSYIDTRVTLISFDYNEKEDVYPFYLKGMTPHIKDIIAMHSIDLLITADSGYTQYPFNTISEIPIIMVNIFGSPTLQKNITPSLFISEAVRKHSEKYVGTKKEDRVVYLSTPAPPEKAKERGKEIRKSFGIKDDDFVLGRIGRNADAIFDPIGIRAFQKIVPQDATIHYIIMSPPPILEKIVKEEGIPNVHFIPPNGDELAIWGFHYAIDCLAHFRYDGETYGMNITESMSVGNPIISHKSTIWNAHSEYLTPGFARIAEIGDTLSYASFIKEYKEIYTHDRITWEAMRKEARRVADNLFSEKAYTISIKEIITQSLSSPL